jgi:hypothetical protein
MDNPFFASLRSASRILIAGAGGGFDIFNGIPLYFYLTGIGKTVHLASLSFARLGECGCDTIGGKAWIVDRSAKELDYFPERCLVKWFEHQGQQLSIIAFRKSGVMPLHDAYRAVIEKFGIDTVVLVDGGTDSLIKGDEPGIGSVVEDAASIVAVNELDVPRKMLACLGFGVDHFHGVSHHSFLENTAELARVGAFMGCFSLTPEMPEARRFLDAVDYANAHHLKHRSIVCNSVARAIRGEFGDLRLDPTKGDELFINPLMSLYWCYDVPGLSATIGFYDAIRLTSTSYDVWDEIHRHREQLRLRPRKAIPL